MLQLAFSALIRASVKNTKRPYQNADNVIFLVSHTSIVAIIALYLAYYDDMIVWLDGRSLSALGLVFLAVLVWACWKIFVFWEKVGHAVRLRLSAADDLRTLRQFMREKES